MCFWLQRRAIFHIPTSKSGPKLVCFVHFELKRCFSLRRRAIFHLSSKQVPPHPAALPSPLFGPADPQIIEKTQHFATSLTFRASASSFFWLSRKCIFFLLTLLLFSAFHLLTLLLCTALQLSILSEVRLLNFLWWRRSAGLCVCVYVVVSINSHDIQVEPPAPWERKQSRRDATFFYYWTGEKSLRANV